ncbi:ABC-trans-aux domain-containing protein [Acetobacteraceae bacterium EV16G]|uniref:ABC-trans-aux domain-containing protein n=1 Tax=Sorlinia euscelidii TaxID=3081148 RepID=A0ABU7U3Y9_9PROT
MSRPNSSLERRRHAPLSLRHLMRVAGVTALLAASGCGRDPTLYTIVAVPGPVTPETSSHLAGIGPKVVEVRTPVVSTMLDRDEIVRQSRDYKLNLAKGDSWAQPLGETIGQALTLDIAQRLPGITVFAQNDAVDTHPQAYVELTVTAFNQNQQGDAVIQGSLAVHPAEEGLGPVQTTPFYETMKLPSNGSAHLVYALSQLLSHVADKAVAQIRACPVPQME